MGGGRVLPAVPSPKCGFNELLRRTKYRVELNEGQKRCRYFIISQYLLTSVNSAPDGTELEPVVRRDRSLRGNLRIAIDS